MKQNVADAQAAGLPPIAAHPRLESTILPIMRKSIDGMSISIVKS